MLIRVLSAALTCCLLGLPLAGCPSCPYDSKCDGDVLKTCSLGVDQIAGKPSKTARACADPNPVCVTLDERTAQCAMDDATECDAEFIPRCEGGIVVSCANAFLVAQDCVGNGNACFELAPGPLCALDPLTDCDPSEFESYCQGASVISCPSGYLQAQDCSLGNPDGACEDYENDYGHSAYCTGG